MSKNATIALVVIVLVILAGWYFVKSQKGTSYTQVPTPQASPAEISSASPSASPSETASKNVVKITASGFIPQNITIKAGESVTWMNDDSADHTVNSAVHPTHQVYPPLNLGLIKPGESKSLTFPDPGTFKYHDHLNPSLNGSVTVQ